MTFDFKDMFHFDLSSNTCGFIHILRMVNLLPVKSWILLYVCSIKPPSWRFAYGTILHSNGSVSKYFYVFHIVGL
jgi:hypothetical protein